MKKRLRAHVMFSLKKISPFSIVYMEIFNDWLDI